LRLALWSGGNPALAGHDTSLSGIGAVMIASTTITPDFDGADIGTQDVSVFYQAAAAAVKAKRCGWSSAAPAVLPATGCISTM